MLTTFSSSYVSFYVQCRDIKESWHKTVLKYWSMKTMMMELQKKACTLENAWRFCKTQTENNSWSYNGLSVRHEDNGFDLIPKVPSFKLAPEGHTKSFSTLPLDAILNGAIMVPGGGRFWALLSPREQMLYTKLFQWVVHLLILHEMVHWSIV